LLAPNGLLRYPKVELGRLIGGSKPIMTKLLVPLMALAISLVAGESWSEKQGKISNGIERVSAGLIFEGVINSANVERLKEALRENDTLLINSSDGDTAAAVDLVDTLRKQNVSVSVNGECIRACADYVFLLSPRRSAELAFSVLFTKDQMASEPRKDLEKFPQAQAFLNCISSFVDRHHFTETALGLPGVAVPKSVLNAFGIEVGGKFQWADTPSWKDSAQSAYPVPMLWMASVSECQT
jgi:hypothetical protein